MRNAQCIIMVKIILTIRLTAYCLLRFYIAFIVVNKLHKFCNYTNFAI